MGSESAEADFPSDSVAVSRTRSVWPSSAILTVYLRPQAPVMPSQLAPAVLQRSQSKVGVAPAGVHAPPAAVSSESGAASPEIVGACVTVAANAVVAATPATTIMTVIVVPVRQRRARFCSADSAMSCISSCRCRTNGPASA